MTATKTNMNVTVKFFNNDKGFGFFKQSEGKDIFVRFTALKESGFDKLDMIMGKTASVDFVETEKGLIVTKINSIGDKKAPVTHTRIIVDQHDEKVIVKVTDLATSEHSFEVRMGAIDGKWQGVFITLTAARKAIGKKIVHLVSEGHGKKTNVPRQWVRAA